MDVRNVVVNIDFQCNSFLVGNGLHHGDGRTHEIGNCDAASFNTDLSGLSARRFEQVAHHGTQLVHAAENCNSGARAVQD